MIQKLNKLNEVADNLDRDRFRILIETGTEFLMLKTNYMDDKVEKEAPLYHKYIISTVASITATANIYKIKIMMNRGAPEKESK